MNKKLLIIIISICTLLLVALGIYIFIRKPENVNNLKYSECSNNKATYYAFDYANDVDVFTNLDFSHNTIYEDKEYGTSVQIKNNNVLVTLNNNNSMMYFEITTIKNPLSVGVISDGYNNQRIVVLSEDENIYYVNSNDLVNNDSSNVKKYNVDNVKEMFILPNFKKISLSDGKNPILFVRDKEGEIFVSEGYNTSLININLLARELVTADLHANNPYYVYAVNKSDDLKFYSFNEKNYCYNDYTYFEYNGEVPLITDYFVANINMNGAYDVFMLTDKDELLYYNVNNNSKNLKKYSNKKVKELDIKNDFTTVHYENGLSEVLYKNNVKDDEEEIGKRFDGAGIVYTTQNIDYDTLDFTNSLSAYIENGSVYAEKNKLIFKQIDYSNESEEYDEDGKYIEHYIDDYIVEADSEIKSIVSVWECGFCTNLYYLTVNGDVYNIELDYDDYISDDNIKISKYSSNVESISSIDKSNGTTCEEYSVALKNNDGTISVDGQTNKYKRRVFNNWSDVIYMYNYNNKYITSYDFNKKDTEYYLIKDEKGKVIYALDVFYAYLGSDEEETVFILGEDNYLYYLPDGIKNKSKAIKYSDIKVKSINAVEYENYIIKYNNGKTEILYMYY